MSSLMVKEVPSRSMRILMMMTKKQTRTKISNLKINSNKFIVTLKVISKIRGTHKILNKLESRKVLLGVLWVKETNKTIVKKKEWVLEWATVREVAMTRRMSQAAWTLSRKIVGKETMDSNLELALKIKTIFNKS